MVVAVEGVAENRSLFQPVLPKSGGVNGVFYGFDFHVGVGEQPPQLIEVNTNAGGALMSLAVTEAQRPLPVGDSWRPQPGVSESIFLEMFRCEWATISDRPLTQVAIVDSAPASQFMYAEFLAFRSMFERAGISAIIADPSELVWTGASLTYRGQAIDLVYNRLTDFALVQPENTVVRSAWLSGKVAVTPHPYGHATRADKTLLSVWSDPVRLRAAGVEEETIRVLSASIPSTIRVDANNAEDLWKSRAQYFFKPRSGFGGRAVYRGDKVTRGRWAEVIGGDYVAQRFVPPATRRVCVDGVDIDLKYDVRAFVYDGTVQLVVARLYQGQTTNMRTPGGGFAAVLSDGWRPRRESNARPTA